MDPITIIAAAKGLAQFAPSIMRFFGVGEKPVAVAEKIVGMAQVITGATSPEAAAEALRQNSQLAHEFNMAVLAADTELEKLALADRADARSRDVEIRKLTGDNKRADLMILLDVIGLITCLVVLIFFRKDLPGEVVGIISTVAGLFGACLRDAHQFEFGSSRSSQRKDDVIGEIAKMP